MSKKKRPFIIDNDLGVNLKPARELGMITIKVVDPIDALLELEALVGFALR